MEFSRQEGRQEERFEDGQETPDGGADRPQVAAVPAAAADPGLSLRCGPSLPPVSGRGSAAGSGRPSHEPAHSVTALRHLLPVGAVPRP
jgi:hypothetical protein